VAETAPFQCPYAPPGLARCPESICDCFIDTHPDDPFGLHPEDFIVGRVIPPDGAGP
jgi:hypothetical protein